MNTAVIGTTLDTLYSEIIDGARRTDGAYMLNTGDAGLLRSLDKVSASAASRTHGAGGAVGGGATIAAHVEHLRYGLALMNRWAAGEKNPWLDADWAAAWRTSTVTDEQWSRLRARLGDEARRWLTAIAEPREVNEMELNTIVGNIGHLAYHLGAIRQIDRATRGPSATESAP
jgi:hypothetical protein